MVIAPSSSAPRTGSGNSSNRSKLATWLRDLPTISPTRFLRVAELVDQPTIADGLLDRVQVGALDILDDRDFERFALVQFAHDRRDIVEAQALRRTPAPFARDDFVTAVGDRADQDRLQHAARRDRFAQFLQRCLVEHAPRLARVGRDLRDRNILRTGGGSCDLDVVEQRRQPAPKSRLASARAIRPPPRASTRPRNSRGQRDIGFRSRRSVGHRSARAGRGSVPRTGARCAGSPSRTPHRRSDRADVVGDHARSGGCVDRTWSARPR